MMFYAKSPDDFLRAAEGRVITALALTVSRLSRHAATLKASLLYGDQIEIIGEFDVIVDLHARVLVRLGEPLQ